MKNQEDIEKRRTFGIISHPDAGKTTLTEKLLLFGGAIQTAGAVKNNKIKKSATSDFMEIEKQRGISVATSVMAFEYNGKQINILDTPGHKDFAEDTFRTLTAVDSVILVIDCANGVEEQTRKLMEVCRMRKTPVIIFINKMDRDGKEAFDLLDELGSQDVLQLLVEGGPTVAAAFHRENLINQYVFHLAPALTGGNDSLPIFENSGISTMAQLWRGKIVASQQLDDDLEVILEPNSTQQET